MKIRDPLAHATRAAVHHQPKFARVVVPQLDEMLATAQAPQLTDAVPAALTNQTGIAQGNNGELLGQGLGSEPLERGHRSVKFTQQRLAHALFADRVSRRVEGKCRVSTPDVTAH